MKKVAFVGKGGSGKTTFASLFSRFLGAQHDAVLAIDADINQHLGEALGLAAHEVAGVPPHQRAGVCHLSGIFRHSTRTNKDKVLLTFPVY